MLRKNKKILFLSAGAMISAISIAVPIVTSCSSIKANPLIELNNKYLSEESKYLFDNDAMLPKYEIKDNGIDIEANLNALINNAKNAVNALEKYKTGNKLNANEKIWIDSYIFKWENKINNIKSGMLFLGANPIIGNSILGSSSNHIINYIKSGMNIYPINPETGDPDITKNPVPELINNLANKLSETADIVEQFHKIIKYGANYGFMPSNIAKKLVVNQFVKTFYEAELEIKKNETTFTISQLVDTVVNGNYFDKYFSNIEKKLNNSTEVKNKLNKLKNNINNFVKYYANEYYKDSHSYPIISNINAGNYVELSLNKSSNFEDEWTIDINGTKLYGLGLTKNDLMQNKIGIGFMNIDKSKFINNNLFFENGNDVYQQLLVNNNSIKNSAKEIFLKGIELTNRAKTNMTNIANKVSLIITNGFNGKIDYDSDGIGEKTHNNVPIEGTNDFEKFNNWLNQEDFFFGRETTYKGGKKEFIKKYWENLNKDKTIDKYKNILISQGYEKNWNNENLINGKQTGAVQGKQALAGAILSFIAYEDFHKKSNDVFDKMFNKIDDYVLSPYEYSIRDFIGVGMEGPRGSKQFQYNVDPYYSLPKWSISSLTSHEGKMGHHTQQQYWTEHLQGGDGNGNVGPGYTFENVAFHEGWAVFAEWYTNELGIYGNKLDPVTRMPTDFTNGKGIVPKYDENNTKKLTEIMKELHGGVYYEKASDRNNQKLKNSIQLANMLQYYGYLNEAQLRNMRLAVDVAFHFNSESINSKDETLTSGASIQNIRKFMQKNSALGVGDINSESIRYAVIPSQATGYMLGKVIFEDLYKDVQKKLNKNLNEIKNSDESKKLFDLMLRNGEIPLEVLKNTIHSEYNITKTQKK